MAIFSDQDTRLTPESLSSGSATATSTTGCDVATTAGERALLFTTVFLLPLENHIPNVAGLSSQFLIFAILAAYVAINRLRYLDRIWMHPVFVAAYVFIGISIVLEFANPLSSYEVIGRFAFMIGAALLVASLCRDRAALKVFLYGYIGAALWLGALLILTTYGALSAAAATGFHDASQMRNKAFSDSPIKGNLNAMAFNCIQGAIVAVAFALGSASALRRNLFAATGIFCLVASSLPMSRGAIVNAMISCGALLKAYGIGRGKVWLLVAVTAISAVLLVPNAVWKRMVFEKMEEAGRETRVSLYLAAWESVDDYLFMGVGAGNYVTKWGVEHGFVANAEVGTKLAVVHNIPLQVVIYWGLISLLAYLVIIWHAYRCLPRTCGKDVLALGMLGIAVSLILMMPVFSEFYYKGFSLGLGMLVAYQRWLGSSSVAKCVNR